MNLSLNNRLMIEVMITLVLSKAVMRISVDLHVICSSKWIKSIRLNSKLFCCRKVALIRRWQSNLLELLVHISNRTAPVMVRMRLKRYAH